MLYIVKLISVFGGIILILQLLPPIVLPNGTVQALSTAFGYAYQFNHIVDIDTLIIIFFLFLISEGIFLVWRVFKFFLFLFKA